MIHWRILLPPLTISLLLLATVVLPQNALSFDSVVYSPAPPNFLRGSLRNNLLTLLATVLLNRQFWLPLVLIAGVLAKFIHPLYCGITLWRATWVIALLGAWPALMSVYSTIDRLQPPPPESWTSLALSWCYVLALWITTLCTDRGFAAWQWAMPTTITPPQPLARWRATAWGLALLAVIEGFRLAWHGPDLLYGGAIAAGLAAALAWTLQLVGRSPRAESATWPQLAISDLLVAITLFAVLLTVYNVRVSIAS